VQPVVSKLTNEEASSSKAARPRRMSWLRRAKSQP